MKTLISRLILLLVLLPALAQTQNATITIPNVSYCDNTTILVPVNGSNLYNVGAMTLDIAFDTLVCSFKSLQNIHPAFSGLFFNVIHTPQTMLKVVYYSMTGANLASGKIFDIEFLYKSGQTNLQFLSTSELTSTTFQPIPTTFNNGSVSNLVNIIQHPQNQTVFQYDTAYFQIVVSGTPTYQWQQSINNGATWLNLSNGSVFQGVTTSELRVQNANLFLNGRWFRCVVTAPGCQKFSQPAVLTVLPPPPTQYVSLPSGWSSLSTYIDPINKNLSTLFQPVNDKLVILLTGSQMYFPSQNINTIGQFDPRKGYTIKMNGSGTVSFTGNPQSNLTLELPEGWSHLPVLVNCDITVQQLFGSQISNLYMVKEIAGAMVYWPEMNINTLSVMKPGRAYLVRMLAPVSITYPTCN